MSLGEMPVIDFYFPIQLRPADTHLVADSLYIQFRVTEIGLYYGAELLYKLAFCTLCNWHCRHLLRIVSKHNLQKFPIGNQVFMRAFSTFPLKGLVR